jgi:hypothetical protein
MRLVYPGIVEPFPRDALRGAACGDSPFSRIDGNAEPTVRW